MDLREGARVFLLHLFFSGELGCIEDWLSVSTVSVDMLLMSTSLSSSSSLESEGGGFCGWLGEWWFKVGGKCRGIHHALEKSGLIIEPGLLCCCLRCCFLSDLVAKFRELSGGLLSKLENVVSGRLHKRECCECLCVDACALFLVLSVRFLLLSGCLVFAVV